jgi:hypothetical protein
MLDDRIPRARNKINRDDPHERGRQFLDVRSALLRPKGAAEGAPAGPDSTRRASEPERQLPRDFRVRLVEQYRRHQRAETGLRLAAQPAEAAGEAPWSIRAFFAA